MTRSYRFTRYMLRELMGPTLLGLLLYTFVLMMNHFFLVAEQALTKNLGAELTFRLFVFGIPRLLVMSIPLAVLLGALIALGRLSADHEWIALQSAGHGVSVVLKPVLLHGLIGAFAAFLIYAVVVPQTNYGIRNLRGEILFSSNLAADLKPRVFQDLPDDAVMFVDEIKPGGQRRLENVLLIQPDPETSATQFILARYGDLYPAQDGTGALVMDLYDGEFHQYRADQPQQHRYSNFEAFQGKRFEPFGFIRSLLNPPDKVAQDMSLTDLWREVQQARQRRQEVHGQEKQSPGRILLADRRLSTAKVELHQRLALPMAAFCFALLALPLGITGVRSGKGAGFAMSVVVLLIYRVVFVLSRNQAVNGNIPADLGPWVANIVILLWAAVAFWRMRRAPAAGPGGPSLPFLAWTTLLSRLRQRRRSGNGDSPADGGAPSSDLVALGGTSRRFVGRLDRYIGMAYLRTLVFALISAYLIYALVELQDLMDSILRTNQPLSLILTYFQYFAPGVLHVVLPISCLVGGIVAFTLLSRTSELVAVKASGVSMQRTTVPVLILTLLLCAFLFLIQDRIAPAANRRAQEIKDQIMKRAPRTHGLPATGAWSFGPEGRELFHYRLYDPAQEEFQGLSVFTLDLSAPRITDYRFSERVRWAGGPWSAEGGWHRTFTPRIDESGQATMDSTFDRFEGSRSIELDIPRHFVREKSRLTKAGDDSEQMSLSDLQEQIDTLKNSGYDITKLEVAYHGKLARSLSPLVMVLLGLPFAFKVGRRGSLYGIGVALLLVLVYWATFAVFNALGLETLLQPTVAAWAPNLLFGLVGVYLMLYIKT